MKTKLRLASLMAAVALAALILSYPAAQWRQSKRDEQKQFSAEQKWHASEAGKWLKELESSEVGVKVHPFHLDHDSTCEYCRYVGISQKKLLIEAKQGLIRATEAFQLHRKLAGAAYRPLPVEF